MYHFVQATNEMKKIQIRAHVLILKLKKRPILNPKEIQSVKMMSARVTVTAETVYPSTVLTLSQHRQTRRLRRRPRHQMSFQICLKRPTTTTTAPTVATDKKIMKRKLPEPRDGWKDASVKTHKVHLDAITYHKTVPTIL